MTRRVLLIASVSLLVLVGDQAGAAAQPAVVAQPASVTTVGQFARLPHRRARHFAIRYMTTHPVDPCTQATTPLSRRAARHIANTVVAILRPGPGFDGPDITADAPLGDSIRHLLASIGC